MRGFEEIIFSSDVTKYGLIGIIGLGPVASSQLDKIDFPEFNKILTYNSYRNIDHKSIKQLCDASDVIFVVVNLDDISVGKSIWGLITYLKTLDTNMIIIAKTSLASLNLATTIKKQVPFLDLPKQENRDLLWTLKSLHRIFYYYNDEYNFGDANYPPSMFWESFFIANSEIFIFQGDSVTSLLEKIDKNEYLSKQLYNSEHCILRAPNISYNEIEALDCKLDGVFYAREGKFDDFSLFVGG